MFGGDHRSVTQSVAISPDITIWLYRRSCPDTVCSRDLNIDRFHRTCLQDAGPDGNVRPQRQSKTQQKLTLRITPWLWAVTHAALFAT